MIWGAAIHGLKKFGDFRIVGCEVGDCNIVVGCGGQSKDKDDRYTWHKDDRYTCNLKYTHNFRLRLRNPEVYSYAVTPKESVQRVSAIKTSERTRQFLLGMAAMTGGLNIDQVTDFVSESGRRTYEISRQPLVVGFSADNDRKESREETYFGWLIGPKIDLEENADWDVGRVPITNSLSALISVPSWWTKASVKVTVCWLSPYQDNLEHLLEPSKLCEKDPGHDPEFELDLPGDVFEIKRRLRFRFTQVPRIDPAYKPEDYWLAKFYVGQPNAQLLIRGTELWRSTVVTMGSQKAELIEVLPDMKGILATFKEVKEPSNWQPGEEENECYGDSKVVVWTSEGHTNENRFVRIYRNNHYFRVGDVCLSPPPSKSENKQGSEGDSQRGTGGMGKYNSSQKGLIGRIPQSLAAYVVPTSFDFTNGALSD